MDDEPDEGKNVPPAPMTPDPPEDMSVAEEVRDINWARRKRKDIINNMLSRGVPSDVKEVSVVLGALNDMDRTSIQRLRVKVDTGKNDAATAAASIIAAALNQIKSNTFGQIVHPDAPEPPKFPDGMDIGQINPAHQQIGTLSGTFDAFMAAQPEAQRGINPEQAEEKQHQE